MRQEAAADGEILEAAMVMHLIAFPQFLIEIPDPPSRAAIGHLQPVALCASRSFKRRSV